MLKSTFDPNAMLFDGVIGGVIGGLTIPKYIKKSTKTSSIKNTANKNKSNPSCNGSAPKAQSGSTQSLENNLLNNTDEIIEGGSTLGKLKSIGNGAWESTEGLIYEQGSKQGNRVLHVLEHTVPDPSKPLHTVFNVGRDKVLGVVDEAWSMKDSVTPILQKNGNQVFDIPMGKIVGTNGETTVRIVVENGTSKIVTSFPVK